MSVNKTLGPAPPCPLHPNCRCILIPQTKSWRELGLDIDELEEVSRPYVYRTNTKSRRIVEVGFHGGDYHSFFNQQGHDFKRNLIGPKRLALIDQNKISFKDIVNPKTGRLQTLKQLERMIDSDEYDMLREARKFKQAGAFYAVSNNRVNRLIDKCFI